jgi:hypothetical protein
MIKVVITLGGFRRTRVCVDVPLCRICPSTVSRDAILERWSTQAADLDTTFIDIEHFK